MEKFLPLHRTRIELSNNPTSTIRMQMRNARSHKTIILKERKLKTGLQWKTILIVANGWRSALALWH